MAGKNTLTLCAVGDIVGFYKDTESAFKYVGQVLREADITFAQNERHYTDKTDLAPRGRITEVTTPRQAQGLKLGGFDVISCASNHSLDLGPDVMLGTIGVLKGMGIEVIGAGGNIDEARKPAIFERNGTRVGFLAYASVIRGGDAAGKEVAGVAPMRAYTLYNQTDYQPGTPPQIITFPYKEDLQALIADITKLRSRVDVVAVSFHWGVHFHEGVIATYQKDVAHAAIDAGADLILGHHPHQLKGIEVYRGKTIFYSMGNFIFDRPYESLLQRQRESPDLASQMALYGWKADPEWVNYCWPPPSRKSMIVRCEIESGKITKVCFLPVLINQKAQPRPLPREDKGFNEVLRYVKRITRSQGLSAKFTVRGDEVLVS